MTLRDLARADRRAMLSAGPYALGEPTGYRSAANADEITISGVWRERPADTPTPHGVGVEAGVSAATLAVAESDVPGLTRGARFRRIATGLTWKVEHIETITGVGYRLHLTREADARLKGDR